MKRNNSLSLIIFLMSVCCGASAADHQKITRDLLCVTSRSWDSVYTQGTDDRLRVDSLTMRALATFPAVQDVTLDFSLNNQVGPSHPQQQIVIHLNSLNTCNRVYAAWPVSGGDHPKVSIKRNPGKDKHKQCGKDGYTRFSAHEADVAMPVAPLLPGVNHKFRAILSSEGRLVIYADGVLVWSMLLPPDLFDFYSPLVGIRTDGSSFTFNMIVTPLGPVGNEYTNPTSIPGYNCMLPPPPSVIFSADSYIMEKGKAVSIRPVSTGGAISSCTVDDTSKLPAGLSVMSDCRIEGTPSVNTNWLNPKIVAMNPGGHSSASLKMRAQSPLTITYVPPV